MLAGRAVLALLAIVVAAATTHARVPGPPERSGRSLTGQLLVATDTLRDPRFVGTVVYMVRHDASGALGLVVNRPLGSAPLARVVEGVGRDATGVSGEIRVHYGGPVEPQRAFVLHSPEWTGGRSMEVQPNVSLTSDPAVFEAIARGTGPRRVLFAVGYAGWSAGQLEDELQRGVWLVVEADEAVIFDDDAPTKWDRAMARRRITL